VDIINAGDSFGLACRIEDYCLIHVASAEAKLAGLSSDMELV
jgi:hypothetical protein